MEFLDELQKIQKNIEEVSGTHTFKLGDVLTDEFIRANTTFRSYDDMFDKSELVLIEKTVEDLYLNEELNAFVRTNTKFENFRDMVSLAAYEYISKKVFDV